MNIQLELPGNSLASGVQWSQQCLPIWVSHSHMIYQTLG